MPAELVAIVERAMHRERDGRYGNVLELAADVRAFLAQRVVKAYRTGAIVEMKLWVRRNRALASSLAAAVLILAHGGPPPRPQKETVQRTASQLAATVRNFNQLSADVLYRRAIANEKELWPAWPHKVEAMERWLKDDCGKLLAMEPEIRRTIDDLRGQTTALPPEQVEADRRTHPRFAEFELLTKQVASLRYAQAIRAGQQQLVVPELSRSSRPSMRRR